MKSSIIAAAAIALATMPSAASAATFLFSYQSTTGLLAGSLTGTLQADNNTVFISSFSNVTFEGAATPALTYVDSYSNFIAASGVPASTSFDGLLQDFITCTTNGCSQGFLFSTALGELGASLQFSAFGGIYDPQAWSLSSVAVPEPASWAMLIAGFGLVGATMRRRRTALAA